MLKLLVQAELLGLGRLDHEVDPVAYLLDLVPRLLSGRVWVYARAP